MSSKPERFAGWCKISSKLSLTAQSPSADSLAEPPVDLGFGVCACH